MKKNMDDNELEEILYRLDERTEHMQISQERVHNDLERLKKQSDKNENLAQKNRTLINGITFGMGSAITVIIARLFEFIQF